MGTFDTLLIEDGVTLPEFPDDGDPQDLDWQTKDIGFPSMDTYKLTADGKLLRKETDRREKTPEEKQTEAEEHDFNSWDDYCAYCESADPEELLEQGLGLGVPRETTVADEFWVNHNQHGTFEFHASSKRVDGYPDFFWSYEARFTKGELEKIVFLGERHNN